MAKCTLGTLLRRLPEDWALAHSQLRGRRSTPLSGVAEDSTQVTPGTFFVAHGGRGTDGHRYIAKALEAGAVAVAGERPLTELPVTLPEQVPYFQVEDGRLAFSLISAGFFNFPSRRMTVVGVTGTDGKTTTSTLIHSILTAHGLATGLITTIAARIGEKALDTGFHVTTPRAFELQAYLAQMVAARCQAVVVESTSHALDQKRVAHIDYDVAVVTNVTHEHLDWHGTWENYMAAKARLFEMLQSSARKPDVAKSAVLNLDDASYSHLSGTVADAIYTYSLRAPAEATCSARDIAITRDGTAFLLVTPAGEAPVRLRLFGRYNVANALAAASAGLALGVPLPTIVAGLEAVARVRGRMEWAYRGDFDVMIDFAHTPNALRETITLAHRLTRPDGRVIVVFGSAGLRDVAKRKLMGEAACAADLAVVTAEDPRTEDVHAIIAEIIEGLQAGGRVEGEDFLRVPDRMEAIATAIRLARPGDLIVCCGKAHEQSMCFGTVETPWDEFQAVEAGIAARGLEPASPLPSSARKRRETR